MLIPKTINPEFSINDGVYTTVIESDNPAEDFNLSNMDKLDDAIAENGILIFVSFDTKNQSLSAFAVSRNKMYDYSFSESEKDCITEKIKEEIL